MKERTQFVSITETTAFGARDGVLDDLNKLTDGNAYKAIQYVQEFLELERICDEFRQVEKEEEVVVPVEKIKEVLPKGGQSIGINRYGEVVKSCDDNTTLPHKILNDFNKGIH